jgi:hypothetical protein
LIAICKRHVEKPLHHFHIPIPDIPDHLPLPPKKKLLRENGMPMRNPCSILIGTLAVLDFFLDYFYSVEKGAAHKTYVRMYMRSCIPAYAEGGLAS